MAEHTLSSIDGDAAVEINQIESTRTLPRGGYQVRITSHDPKPARMVITVDHDGIADLLCRVLLGDHSLLTDVRHKLFVHGQKI